MHRGHRVFVLGNGPSLKVECFEPLRQEITFGMNQMFKCFDQTSWRPTYYAISDSLVAENYGRMICQNYGGIIFASEHLQPILGRHPRVVYFPKTHEVYEEGEPAFSPTPLPALVGAYTTTYLCFQLAWYMGIRDFITLGIDANYSFSAMENHGKLGVYEKAANASQDNWFVPGYFEKDVVLLKPRVKQQVLAYRAARRFIEDHGGRIRNAGFQSPLEVFERVNFDSLFK